MPIEVPNLFHSSTITSPAIRRYLNDPRGWEIAFGIPRCEVVRALYDEERRQAKAIATNALDSCCPFTITRLKLLTLSTSIRTRYDHISTDNAHHKACLVKVVDVRLLDAVPRTYIRYEPKPRV